MALLLAVLGSNWSAWLIVAVLVTGFGLVTVARIASVSGDPTATVPTSQCPVAGSYVPWLVVSDTNVRPEGRRSVTWAPVAGSGPLLPRETVKVTVSPTLGVGLSTVLASARSACCGVRVAVAVLLEVLGSNWSAWLIVAVFVRALGLVTVARIASVTGDPTPTVPTLQRPLAEL